MFGLEKRDHGKEKMEMGTQRAMYGRGNIALCQPAHGTEISGGTTRKPGPAPHEGDVPEVTAADPGKLS